MIAFAHGTHSRFGGNLTGKLPFLQDILFKKYFLDGKVLHTVLIQLSTSVS